MDVWAITIAALRRWYVLLPLLALTVLGALVVGRGMQPEYEATGAVMLVPGTGFPAEDEEVVPNPYGSMDNANSVLAIVLIGPEAREEITAAGLSPDYEWNPTSRSVITHVRVRAATEKAATATATAVVDLAKAEMRDRQAAAGVPKTARYSIEVLQPPYVTATVTEGKLRNMAIIGVLGGALSLLVAVFIDDLVGFVRRRRGRVAQHEKSPKPSGVARGKPRNSRPKSVDPAGAGSGEGRVAGAGLTPRSKGIAMPEDVAATDGARSVTSDAR